MQILKDNRGSGWIELVPHDLDDIYTIFRLIVPDDEVTGVTTRRQRKSGEDVNSDGGKRLTIKLKIKVESVTLHELDESLRVKGIITEGPEDLVSFGQYHTLKIQCKKSFTLHKKQWNTFYTDLLDQSIIRDRKSGIITVLLDDSKYIITRITQHSIQLLVESSAKVTRKFTSVKQNKESYDKYLNQIIEKLSEIIERFTPEFLVIAGPGFTREDLLKRLKRSQLAISADKILLQHVSSAEKSALHELFISKTIPTLVADYQVMQNAQLFESFLQKLTNEENMVCYGITDVMKAYEISATKTILIVDTLLKGINLKERERLESLIEGAKKQGSHVEIIGSESDAGHRLTAFGSIAAILHFPVFFE